MKGRTLWFFCQKLVIFIYPPSFGGPLFIVLQRISYQGLQQLYRLLGPFYWCLLLSLAKELCPRNCFKLVEHELGRLSRTRCCGLLGINSSKLSSSSQIC